MDEIDSKRYNSKIMKILNVAQQHVSMAMNERMTDEVTSTRLVRQIHHVMRDVINPRLCVKNAIKCFILKAYNWLNWQNFLISYNADALHHNFFKRFLFKKTFNI